MSMKCNYCGEPIDGKSIYWEDSRGNFYCRERHLDAFELAQEKSPSDPACSITLPKINDELWEDYNETGLMTWKDGGPHWTQLAVDFACVLKTQCIGRQR